ncbi:unnamed protein product, partial [Phaeothamnion confervicola]
AKLSAATAAGEGGGGAVGSGAGGRDIDGDGGSSGDGAFRVQLLTSMGASRKMDASQPRTAALPLPPPAEEWPQAPLFVRLSPLIPRQSRLDGMPDFAHVAFNGEEMAVPFETAMFRGRVVMRVAGRGDSPRHYFEGRARLWQCCVQGEFKRECRFGSVYTGQVFARPFTKLPPKWLLRSAATVLRRLTPALRADVAGDMPYLISPLVATAQALRVEEPGEETDIGGGGGGDGSIIEDNALLGGGFAERGVSAAARKKFFSKLAHLDGFVFRPGGLVYTFDFYQHLFNLLTFEVDLGFKRLQLAHFLGQQPVQIMAQDLDSGAHLWNFEV